MDMQNILYRLRRNLAKRNFNNNKSSSGKITRAISETLTENLSIISKMINEFNIKFDNDDPVIEHLEKLKSLDFSIESIGEVATLDEFNRYAKTYGNNSSGNPLEFTEKFLAFIITEKEIEFIYNYVTQGARIDLLKNFKSIGIDNVEKLDIKIDKYLSKLNSNNFKNKFNSLV